MPDILKYNPETEKQREATEWEEQILNILNTIEKHKGIGTTEYLMHYGMKQISLTHDTTNNRFETAIFNIGTKEEKKDHETTLLYEAAKRKMQEIVQTTKKDLPYTLESTFPQITEWARKHGQEIFEWEDPNGKPSKHKPDEWTVFETNIRYQEKDE